jgi:hypothetical protein
MICKRPHRRRKRCLYVHARRRRFLGQRVAAATPPYACASSSTSASSYPWPAFPQDRLAFSTAAYFGLPTVNCATISPARRMRLRGAHRAAANVGALDQGVQKLFELRVSLTWPSFIIGPLSASHGLQRRHYHARGEYR